MATASNSGDSLASRTPLPAGHRLTTAEYQLKQTEKKKKWGGSERHYIWGEARNYISGFEGSQAVPVRPSGTSNAYERN
jgi:hypothetical protein